METISLQFPSLELLAQFLSCSGVILSEYNMTTRTLTGEFSEADIELAVRVFDAVIVKGGK